MEAVMGVANAMGDMVVNERLTVDGVDVLVGYANEGDQHVTETEIRAYLERGALKHPNSAVTGLALLVDGEDVDIRYELAPVPFDRIRWNDAKTSEESDRVKHGVCRDDRAFACANGC